MTDERDADELPSLYRWLSNDPELAQQVEFSIGQEEPEPGAMGLDLDQIVALVSAVTGTVGAAAGVYSGIAQWRSTRPRGTAQVTVVSDSGEPPIVLDDEEQRSPGRLGADDVGGTGPVR
ncbi:effector-associated constant component EACC1 [Streptomyces sp. NPDC002913]